MTSTTSLHWLWAVFAVAILAVLALDLGVVNRREQKVSVRASMAWVGVWVTLALAFCAGIYVWLGHVKALEFLTGYIVEQALSVDNIFVFIVIFGYFRVPREYHHRVLFWGVLGAFVLRAVFIFVGTALIARFHWILYLFGAFLVFTGVKLVLTEDEGGVDPSRSWIVSGFRRVFPVSESYEGAHFVTRRAGRLAATPLLVVLAMVEGTDVVFAFDSIPAIFGVTTDPFIVYTSNVFAILGLRNLYFVLADFMDRFEYLKYGLGVVLAFIGVKMLASRFYEVPIGLSLGLVAVVLLGSVAASLAVTSHRARRDRREAERRATREDRPDPQA